MCNLSQYIIANCVAVSGGLVPCVKQSVYAMLVTEEGKEFFGANWMTNKEVTVCPRVTLKCKTGEGYEHCKDTCNQEFHAEPAVIDAAINAGYSVVNAVIYVVGHTVCCDNCRNTMYNEGVSEAIVLDSGAHYVFNN